MKIKNIIIIILTLIFGVVETWGQTEVTTPLTTATTTLKNDSIYKVEKNLTITNSTITVATGATATIYIAKGVTLTITGQAGSGQTGAYPAICVPVGTTLIITGEGKLIATGGDGGDGVAGSMINADGGNGGGGAAPAIGGKGGTGGEGGINAGTNKYGLPGDKMGGLFIISDVKVQATAGGTGDSKVNTPLVGGGNGGQTPSYAIGAGGKGGNSKDGESQKNNDPNKDTTPSNGVLYIENPSNITGSTSDKNGERYMGISPSDYQILDKIKTTIKFSDRGNELGSQKEYYYGVVMENAPIPGDYTGYTFDGYSYNGTQFFDKDCNPTPAACTIIANGNEVTLYAQWAPNVYLVTFNENHEEGNSFNKEETYDAKYVLPEQPTRTHYDFIGWFDAPENGNQITTDSDVKVTEDNQQTLYAYWTGKKYNTTFNANNGSFEDSSSEKIIAEEYASKYTLPTSLPSHTGYTFIGWYTTADGGEQVTTNTIVEITDNNQILYAHWTANTYQVSFNPKGGSEVPKKDVTFDSTYGDLPTPTRTGYTFTGWFTAETDGTEVKSTSAVTTASDHTLYAHWTANTYQVSFNSNGGDEIPPIDVTYDGTYENLPDATRYGYDFDGWYTEGGEKIEKTDEVDITSDMRLYAHWSPKATNFEAYTASGLGGYYFRSFFDSKVAYEMPDKVMAFTAKVDNDYLLLTAIEGNIIPKETPVILRAEESAIVEDGDKNYITLVTSESGKSISAENVLLGTDDDMDSHSDNCYILSHGTKGLGFYKWPTGKTLKAHKAYYIDGGSSSAKALIFRFEDETTGINNEIIDSASDESEPVIYNLSGIRISKPQKGINIIKGKKVWVPGDR